MLETVLALVSLIAMLIILRPFVEILPSLLACLIRWKESVNLENVLTYARYRNWTAAILILPFCILVHRHDLYAPAFLEDMNDSLQLLTTIGVMCAYLLLRHLFKLIFRPKKISGKCFTAADRSSYNFFILLTLLLLAVGSTASFCEAAPIMIKRILFWTICAIYSIACLRKLQILSSGCRFLPAFLYLCALEILPTGVLVTSAIIF